MTRHAKPALTPKQLLTAIKIITRRIKPEHVEQAARLLGESRSGREGLKLLQQMMLELAQTGAGTKCVVCGGHFQVQYRVINRAMARVATDMCYLWQRMGYAFADQRTPMFLKPEHHLQSASECREFPKLRFWKLATGRPGSPEEPGTEGTRWTEWTIYSALYGYVFKGAKLRRWAVIVHDELIDLVGPLQDIGKVEKFSLKEYLAEIEGRG